MVNEFIIARYATPAVVEYLHVAALLVARLITACVVPAGNMPDGAPLKRTGGVVSAGEGGGATETVNDFVPAPGSLPWLFEGSFAVAK